MRLSREQRWLLRKLQESPTRRLRLRDGNQERTARALVLKGLARWEPPGTRAELVLGAGMDATAVEVVPAEQLEGAVEAMEFVRACIPAEHPSPHGIDACWLCAAETALDDALGGVAERSREATGE